MSNIKLIDSHVNFGHELMSSNFKDIIKESLENNIFRMLCINSNLSEFDRDLKIIKNHDFIDISLGHHPNLVEEFSINDIEASLENKLSKHKRIIAVGETGLDYYYDANKLKQIDSLSIHFEKAAKYQLPIIIHMRESEDEIIPIIKNYRNKVPNILIHCFTGTDRFGKACIDLDCYFSISGIITFKNADKLRNTIKILPKNRIIFETDSPYLTPDPHRGEINHPKNLGIILEKYCDIMQFHLEEMSEISNKNYINLFNKNS